MKVKIEIDTQTFVRFWLVVIGFVLVALAVYSARVALIILGSALFFAIALSPSVNRLARSLPSKSRVLGTAIAYIVVVLVLGLIAFLIIPPIVDQTVKFAQTVPNLVDTGAKQYEGVSSFINHYNLQPEFTKAVNSIKDGATQFASGFGSILINSIGSVFAAITAVILVLVLSFLMLVEGPTWLSRLWSVYDNKERMERHSQVLKRMYSVITGYMTGQLSVSALAGFISGFSVFILSLFFNIPANLAIPAMAIVFVSSLIPLFGSTIGAVLVTTILLLNNVTAAIIFIVFFVLYQQVEANYISPKIQSKRIDLSPLAILASVTIGIYLFGIAGGIISIPIAGCLNIFVSDYFSRVKNPVEKKSFLKKITNKITSSSR